MVSVDLLHGPRSVRISGPFRREEIDERLRVFAPRAGAYRLTRVGSVIVWPVHSVLALSRRDCWLQRQLTQTPRGQQPRRLLPQEDVTALKRRMPPL
jgi:hypothetical protein